MPEQPTTALQTAAAAQDSAETQLPPALQEFGSTGLSRSGGRITEEFLTELVGSRGARTYREIGENDPVGSAMTFSLSRLICRLPWSIEPPENPDAEELRATRLCQEAFEDMETPWSNVIEDIASMGTYGWSLLEQNFKIRGGPDEEEDWRRSNYTDGLVGWKSFRIRAQDTLVQWEFDEKGNLLGMQQMDPSQGGMRTIPLKKALLFRTTTARDNPEGRSLLRGAYRSWFYKKRIEEYEAMGIERDLAGLPKATLPMDYFAPNADDGMKRTVAAMKELVTSIRNDASGGLVLPVAYDTHGNKLIDVELMSSAGAKQIDTNAIIKRKSEEMAMSIIMDFLMLGHQNVGSFALGTAKIDLWQMSIDALARGIAETFRDYAIRLLLRINRIQVRRLPVLAYGDVANQDLGTLGSFLTSMVDASLLTPGPELEKFVRDAAKLPADETLPFDDAPTQ
jgi:hypothetical protein